MEDGLNCKNVTTVASHKAQNKALRKSKRITNPLQAGIVNYLSTEHPGCVLGLKDIPKRYSRYGSLLLLGPTFLSHSQTWSELLDSLVEDARAKLYRHIVHAFGDPGLTHVAINAPIAPDRSSDVHLEPNETRSPIGLLPVYGDFGPGPGDCNHQHPTPADLDDAYWTQTVQLNGIVQVWAPRWTMFSRGNIAEKSRILQAGLSKSPFPGLDEVELSQSIGKVDVVDFYVGIGYFAFCYLARGVARVWGWEINGWSVEGLRRGCVENGWNIRVIRIDENGNLADGQNIPQVLQEIQDLEHTSQAIRCITFQGDNKWASQILHKIESYVNTDSSTRGLNIRHCNLGLLPSSEGSWRNAVNVLSPNRGGWLHVHENVETSAIPEKQQHIETQLEYIANAGDEKRWMATCIHTEQVKTYAPGVVHCVFDIHLYPFR